MRVRVLFFGQLKDLVGRSSDELDVAEGASVETVFERYASEFPKLRDFADSIAPARNQEFAALSEALADGDEIAFMPPVSGGREPWLAVAEDERGFYALTDAEIDVRSLARRTLADSDGALITFEGVVRDNTKGRRTLFLDYECYQPLALKKMQEIGRDALAGHDVRAVSIAHRLGRLEIGETSVAIVVASAHRKAAYEASLEAINRLKQKVAIWKKEHFADGEVWVEGQWDDAVPRAR